MGKSYREWVPCNSHKAVSQINKAIHINKEQVPVRGVCCHSIGDNIVWHLWYEKNNYLCNFISGKMKILYKHITNWQQIVCINDSSWVVSHLRNNETSTFFLTLKSIQIHKPCHQHLLPEFCTQIGRHCGFLILLWHSYWVCSHLSTEGNSSFC